MVFAPNFEKLGGSLLASNCEYTFQDENSHSHYPSMKVNLFLPHSAFPKAKSLVSSPCNLLHPLLQLIQMLFINISQLFIQLFTDFSSVNSYKIIEQREIRKNWK